LYQKADADSSCSRRAARVVGHDRDPSAYVDRPLAAELGVDAPR